MTRRPPLGLTGLEDRTTPATYSYAAGTLTVQADTLDAIVVSLLPPPAPAVPGFLQVGTWTSGNDRPVRNLIVMPRPGATSYGLGFLPDVSLTNLTVTGASNGTNVVLWGDTRVTGNFTFKGNPATGNDQIWAMAGAQVGGAVSLALGAGNNTVTLDGGTIGGNLSVTGGALNDTVNLVAGGPLYVGGSVTFALGAGFNQVLTGGFQSFLVGRNLTYTGGSGDDHVDLSLNNAQVRVGGSVSVDMAPATGVLVIPAKYWRSGSLFVGGNFTARRALFVDLHGRTFIGGNVAVSAIPIGGTDFWIGRSTPLNPAADPAVVGGAITFTGGAMDDSVSLDNLTVGRGVTLNLGGGGGMQTVDVGTTQNARVAIAGGLAVTVAGAHSAFSLMRSSVGGALTVLGGAGDDRNWIDDSDIAGPALFDLGGGDDTLQLDIAAVDGAGIPLNQLTRFQSSLTFYGRGGSDTVSLGNPFGGGGLSVGGAVRLFGGADNDNLTVRPFNTYLQTTFEDFEFGDNL